MSTVLETLKAMLLEANSTDPDSLKMILVTSVAVFVGCVFLYLWRFSSSSSSGNISGKRIEPLKPLIVKKDADEVDDGKKKVTIFFGTQTGTAEGFAKSLAEEAKARYEKAVFKTVDLDDYAVEDDEYEEKLKKETVAFFFLATYGDGEPTDNAAKFYRWFTEGEEREPWLQNLQYAIFGLGNRQYEHFNKVAKVVDQRLKLKGIDGRAPPGVEPVSDRISKMGSHGDLTSEERQILLAEFYLRHRQGTMKIVEEYGIRKLGSFMSKL